MDSNTLMLSLFFGAIGMGMFMFGKNTGRMVPLGAGVLLMGIPYFISNAAILLLVCSCITATPWFLRDA